MEHLVVVGGGWAGCAAALIAAKKGMAVTLLERTDRLLASGLVGGIMRNNARYTAAEELKLMGAGELVEITDSCTRHVNVVFPGHRHASLYDVDRVELSVQQKLLQHGVRLLFQCRATGVEAKREAIRAVYLDDNDTMIRGSVFIDASGTAGPARTCGRFGHGCAMCIYRCPTFGPRLSIAVKAGVEEITIERAANSPGYFSGSCELEPSSLSPRLLEEIRQKAVLAIPLPAELRGSKRHISTVEAKACRQYSSVEFRENIYLLDTGAIKLMVPYLSLRDLRRIDGFARAIYRDPLGGGRGNSIRFSGMIMREDSLVAPFPGNLLVAGERAGLALGHTEAMVTGALAGYNAWLIGRGAAPVKLPRGTVCGELIYSTGMKGHTREGRKALYNLSGGLLWEHLREHRLYTIDRAVIRRRLKKEGLLGIFA